MDNVIRDKTKKTTASTSNSNTLEIPTWLLEMTEYVILF